jgi:hypothetical protein
VQLDPDDEVGNSLQLGSVEMGDFAQQDSVVEVGHIRANNNSNSNNGDGNNNSNNNSKNKKLPPTTHEPLLKDCPGSCKPLSLLHKPRVIFGQKEIIEREWVYF